MKLSDFTVQKIKCFDIFGGDKFGSIYFLMKVVHLYVKIGITLSETFLNLTLHAIYRLAL